MFLSLGERKSLVLKMNATSQNIQFRYGEKIEMGDLGRTPDLLSSMIERGSCRSFTDKEVDPQLTKLLCAAALASPTKSDLQQRDIIILRDPQIKADIIKLVGTEPWVPGVPHIAVFCGNNSRQRKVHEIRKHAFANDHLDAFFNAAVDAGIALSAFITAAEILGLGCCPISAVRNEAAAVSALLGLPDHVFPVSGLAFGYPLAKSPTMSMRLPLAATVHEDRYSETDTEAVIAAYDQRREAQQPYEKQLALEKFGKADFYGWSEDKSRQYALPERQSFGDFIRAIGFNLS